MAETTTIARPYAEAVFRLARQNQALHAWSETLSFAAAVAADGRMRACISSPQFTAAQLENLFFSICGDRLNEQGRNFIKVLIANDRLQLLPEILELFERLKAQEEGVIEANVFSAFPMGEDQLKELVNMLEIRFKRKIEASVQVDPELIGGVKVEVGDEVLDASVRGRLATMAVALKS